MIRVVVERGQWRGKLFEFRKYLPERLGGKVCWAGWVDGQEWIVGSEAEARQWLVEQLAKVEKVIPLDCGCPTPCGMLAGENVR